jgi:hypothetical protein
MTGYSLTKVYQKLIKMGIILWHIMVKSQCLYLHDVFYKVPVSRVAAGSPVRGKLLLRLPRVISIVEDKLPEVVIPVQIELGKIHRKASWLGTDYFSIGPR